MTRRFRLKYLLLGNGVDSVSYTHLDVYKRQTYDDDVSLLYFYVMYYTTKSVFEIAVTLPKNQTVNK